MKKKLFILVLIVFGFSGIDLQAQVLPINPDSLNLAVLIVDYDSLVFEGGNMSYYTKCTCLIDSLPFVPHFVSPGDFGSIAFALGHTGDTIFDATIVWMGTGGISFPTDFSMQWPFQYHDLAVAKPQLEYFDWTGQKTYDPATIQKADSAWDVIDSLIITSFFADYTYNAGIYLYPPTVGMFDPSVAKWVVFLYYNAMVYSANESNAPNLLRVSPNPCSDKLCLEFNINGFENCLIEIFSLDGHLVYSDEIMSGQCANLDLSGFSPGVYLLKSNIQGTVSTIKLIKL